MRVPVRKPSKAEFIQTHPDPAMSLNAATYEETDEREFFFVAPAMAGQLVGLVKPVMLLTTITRGGIVLLWPVPLPDGTGRSNPWHETAREAAARAQGTWIRLQADMALGAYRIFEADGDLPEPQWPTQTLNELLEIAFSGRVIDRVDHPIVRRIRGLT